MQRTENKRDKRMDILTFFVIVVFYMEIVLRIFCVEKIIDVGIIYILAFSGVFGLMLKIAVCFFDEKANKIISFVLLGVITFVYTAQVVYKIFFGKFLIIYSMVIGGVEQVANKEMIGTTLQAIKNGILPICIMVLPFVFFCVLGKKIVKTPRAKWGFKGILTIGLVLGYVTVVFLIHLIPEKEDVYQNVFDADILTKEFGLAYMGFSDFKYHVMQIEPEIELEQNEMPEIQEIVEVEDTYQNPEEQREEDAPEEVVYEPNVLNIDFDSLLELESDSTIKMLHEYFKETEPTYKNAYTGMFEGYNLITITAEGFSPYAVDEELTPTLYKMMSEGFQFKNFYTPIWGVSTSDGEYVSCTGLLPKSGVWSFRESGANSMPFCLGNQFEKLGVDLRFAYHNHTYDYYDRDISHPNMGYTYKGLGNGFTEEQIAKVWPESDLQMIEASVLDYLQAEEQFLAYYMTVSGHLEYTRIDNSMAMKNWDLVKDLDASENIKAYLACHIELDRAMEKLLTELEKAGVADKTVIAIVPDHYPYGLEKDDSEDKFVNFRELLGYDVEENFELYKSICILYSPSMEESVVVDKYAANVDLLPTLLNLFGIEYDSRLMVGKDMMSDSEPLVIFSNRSWINEYGRYNAVEETFEVFEGSAELTEEEKEEYIAGMNRKVEDQFKISSLILSENYYAKTIK